MLASLVVHLVCAQEKDQKYMLLLDGLKLKDMESGIFSRHPTFALFSTENR